MQVMKAVSVFEQQMQDTQSALMKLKQLLKKTVNSTLGKKSVLI